MRTVTFVLLCCLLGGWAEARAGDTAAHRQPVWYAGVQLSVGTVYQSFYPVVDDLPAGSMGPHLGAGLTAGVQLRRWQAETGLLYWINWNEVGLGVVSNGGYPPAGGAGTEPLYRTQPRYHYVGIPLRLSFNLTPRSSSAFRPVAGVVLGYNAFRGGSFPDAGLERMSLWGSVGWEVDIPLEGRATAVIGGDASGLVRSFPGAAPLQQDAFVLALRIGVRGLL